MTSVKLGIADGVARIVLDRPDAGNAIDMALAEALADVAVTAANDSAVRCVTLSGAGRMFCVGGDIAAFDAAGDAPGPFLHKLADTLHGAVRTLAEMQKPFVVLVNGPAAGAGMSLALLGDVVIAARSASFVAAYTGIGLTPDGGMSWLLQRLVGLRHAQEIILTNRRVDAEEAQRIGLVTKTVDDDALEQESAAIVATLTAAPTAALGGARSLLLGGATATLAEQLDHEAARIAVAGERRESRELVAAFLARRTPGNHRREGP